MEDRSDFGAESGSSTSGGAHNTSTRTRFGLDVGTSKVVSAKGDSSKADTGAQLNAFFIVPYSSLHESTLQQSRVNFYREGDELVIYGSDAEKFAHMFNAEVRRPMAKGILNPAEHAATHVLETILGSLIPTARSSGEMLAFSVPAAARETGAELTYHEETIKRYLRDRGYTPLAVNEGLAVVLAGNSRRNRLGFHICSSCGRECQDHNHRHRNSQNGGIRCAVLHVDSKLPHTADQLNS